LNDSNADCHKWYAITLGSSSDFLPIKDKIGNGFVFKKHLDRAIELRPDDAALYHLLGRFEFEVRFSKGLNVKIRKIEIDLLRWQVYPG
jgi:regulator of microtubule dynamics protein 3